MTLERAAERALPQLEVWENFIPWEACWKRPADPTGVFRVMGEEVLFIFFFSVVADDVNLVAAVLIAQQ